MAPVAPKQPSRLDSTDIFASPKSPPSTKNKISDRLTKAVNAAGTTKNRSPELIPLTAEYEKVKKKLRNLVSCVKKYAETTKTMQASKDELVQQLALMSEKSPIYDEVGCELDGEATEGLAKIRSSGGLAGGRSVSDIASAWEQRHEASLSSLAILQDLASTQAVVNGRDYEMHVVEYAVEWEKVVTERVDKELKNVRKLQADRTHYEKKVETLRQRTNELEAKGKQTPTGQLDKLQRNETKLKESYMVHESEAGRLCVLIEEVVSNGWLDFYHMAKNYMKWESNRVGRESDIYCQLTSTLDSMKSTFKKKSGNTKKKKKSAPPKQEQKEDS